MVDMTTAEQTAADAIFGDRVDVAARYVRHLATSGIERGLLGPREVPRLWSRHVLNCAVVQELIPHGVTVADVGSGAGLPGVAVAIARPDLRLTLIEPLERRVVWLNEVTTDLGLDNVRIIRARAEAAADEVQAHVATARAVSALSNLLDLTLPLLREDGELLAIKGRSALDEVRKASGRIRKIGAGDAVVVTVGETLLAEPTTVVRVRRARG